MFFEDKKNTKEELEKAIDVLLKDTLMDSAKRDKLLTEKMEELEELNEELNNED